LLSAQLTTPAFSMSSMMRAARLYPILKRRWTLDIEAFLVEPVAQSDLRESIAGVLGRKQPAAVRSEGAS